LYTFLMISFFKEKLKKAAADLDLVNKERTLLIGEKKKTEETVNKLEIQVSSVADPDRAFKT
jgi:hypothetical protein